ncbi:NAD P-binding protein [Gloeophyllum trabeum ATCC 11539]|uniref:NAD P-binding protein n=1 Tax=Gloeophyllum trabeum (strain ATCC 11539 / FP-39264 / Madison 617) TaxID=670483 RepID=S7Q8D9_GLOTA|nr:NAD P-binding protein [Gloeophyllum trabeum ATCC 11539]EPQ55708.1 NAD P-binding protein [Gloeophyllum trabeum ATCC 11539]
MAPPVLLVLGAGSNVGLKVARKFASHGFKVAVAARNPSDEVSKAGDLVVKADFADPSAVSSVFEKVKATLGIPSVVVYNAYSAHASPGGLPLAVPIADFSKDLVVNAASAYAAAHEAVKGFAQLPADASKTFIYTGNILNVKQLPIFASLGAGKSATAHIVEAATLTYGNKGFKFYYADERTADGAPVASAIDGDAHADFYYELSQSPKQQPWLATFVKGKGYVDFSAQDRA